MSSQQVHAVTGALGFSGKYIARRLLALGHQVKTLTNSTQRASPFGDRIEICPFNFDHPPALTDSLKGVSVLYNTYWVRFNHRTFTYVNAVKNTISLFDAAKAAHVERIVHVSITNPSEDSPLEYFRAKAHLEKALKASGLSYAILRPAVLFGKEDILINNIAWMLRRLPVFGVFGDGRYRLQPIYVDDLAQLAIEQGQSRQDTTINAIGPDTFTYRELVGEIGAIVGRNRPIVSVPPFLGYLVAAVIGRIVGDVVITHQEIKGLMANLLYVDAPAAGKTKLPQWGGAYADSLGIRYSSELARR